jgi:hypothetical protein
VHYKRGVHPTQRATKQAIHGLSCPALNQVTNCAITKRTAWFSSRTKHGVEVPAQADPLADPQAPILYAAAWTAELNRPSIYAAAVWTQACRSCCAVQTASRNEVDGEPFAHNGAGGRMWPASFA